MKVFRLGLSLWSLGLISAFGCSGDKAPARGQIMLALHTDMALPKDVSKVKLQVVSAGAKDAGVVKFDRTFSVGLNGEAKIPATFAIVAKEGESPTVEVRVIGIGGTKARTFSKVVTTVPRDRIAVLNMPIQWLCDGTAQTIDSETFESTCPPIGDIETACVAGTCQDVNFPEVKMPDFSPPDVFGGGKNETDPTGKCFDTVACFDPGFVVTPDHACRVTIALPSSRPINFALRPSKASEGICGTKGCYVPLDKSEIFGWSELPPGSSSAGDGGASGLGGGGAAGAGGDSGIPNFGAGSVQRTFQLPKAVCDRVDEGIIASVLATAACDGKTERVPVCGDWYSVAAQRVTPETSTMTGGGTQQSSCPEFVPGNGLEPVSNDPVFDGSLQAASDFKARSDELAKETFDACAGIISDLGGKTPAAAGTPSASAISDACATAQKALSDAGGGTIGSAWSVLVTPGKCALSIDDQATCESACAQSTCKNLPTADKRCAELGGSCAGACTGECSGTHDSGVTCNGSCEGVCNGACDGSCISTEGAPGGTNCGGWCTGNCKGTCAGTCEQSASTCEGTCWVQSGECAGTLSGLVCAGTLTPEDCLGDCGRLCAARASLDQNCQTTTAEVYGSAPALLRTAIDNHYWMLLDVIYRSSGITAVGPLVGQLQAKYASDSATVSDPHYRACLNTAQTALSAAYGDLSAAITSASQTAGAVASGGVVGGTCQNAAATNSCEACLFNSCCSELNACDADVGCSGTGDVAGEAGCVLSCYQGGGGSACESTACKTSATASFSPTTTAYLSCTHAYCESQCFTPSTTPICTGSQQLCNSTCVTVLSDPTNCGGCGNHCKPGQNCNEGACVCPTGTSVCSSGCFDLQNDSSNCGVCGALCGSSLTCVKGACTAVSGAGGAASSAGSTGTAGSTTSGGGVGGVSGKGGAGAGGAQGGGPTGGAGGVVGGVGGTTNAGAGTAGTAGSGAASCPTSKPASGSGCSEIGLQCTFGADSCSCSVDGWSCFTP